MVDFTQIGTVVAIVAICYLVGMFVKAVEKIGDKYIPVIVGTVGGVLGVIGMYVMPEFPANDILNAIAIGIASGLASVGVNQVTKQLKKDE